MLAVPTTASAYYEESLAPVNTEASAPPSVEIIEPVENQPQPQAAKVEERPLPAVQPIPSTTSRTEYAHITQVGSGMAARVSSKGNIVPLKFAVGLLAPQGWHAMVDRKAHMRKVSWDEGRIWLEELDRICGQTDVHAMVDWNAHTVVVRPVVRTFSVKNTAEASVLAKRNKLATDDFCRWNQVNPDSLLVKGTQVYLEEPFPPTRVVPGEAARSVSVPAATASPSVAAPLPVSTVTTQPAAALDADSQRTVPVSQGDGFPDLSKGWALEPGSLRVQVAAWCARGGYQLVWKAGHDYGMESHAHFQGEFIDAVKQLFAGLQQSGLGLRVTLYNNKVMEVTEN